MRGVALPAAVTDTTLEAHELAGVSCAAPSVCECGSPYVCADAGSDKNQKVLRRNGIVEKDVAARDKACAHAWWVSVTTPQFCGTSGTSAVLVLAPVSCMLALQ